MTAIGVFDSGVGGLTVWRELKRHLPNESIVYLGDTAHLPYGVRSPQEILGYVREISTWLQAYPVKMIVMACNTSSALALETVQHEYALPMLGLILPGTKAAVRAGQRIGVIATQATVTSHAYRNAVQELAPTAQCWEVACPEFVPLIESGQLQSEALRTAAARYLEPLIVQNIDTLVYGCTHYPLIDDLIRELLPAEVAVINPAIHLVKAVVQELEFLGLRSTTTTGTTHFYVTGNDGDRFAQLAQQWIEDASEPPLVHVALQA